MHSFMETLEFDLPSALLSQLVDLLNNMTSEQLIKENMTSVPEEQGVYQLLLDDKVVYIGKTDSEAGLKKRLLRHCEKVQSRKGIKAGQIRFKAVRVYVFTAMDLETQLINYYKDLQGSIEWQNSGFGSNDPGRKRDTGKPGVFDSTFAIDVDVILGTPIDPGLTVVAEALNSLKQRVPYVVRFERETGGRAPHEDLRKTEVFVSEEMNTSRKLLLAVKSSLGPEWQITVLPGYVIIYKESRSYSSGEII